MEPSGGLSERVGSGSHLDALRALRDRLASDLEVAERAADVAQLGRLLTDVLSQIAVLERLTPEQKGTPLDQLRKRREDRVAGSSGRARSS